MIDPYRDPPAPKVPEYRVVWLDRSSTEDYGSAKLNALAAEGFRFLSCGGAPGDYQALVIMVRER